MLHKPKRRTRNGIVEKTCRKCGDWRPLDKFKRGANCPDGRSAICYLCANDWQSVHKLAGAERDQAAALGLMNPTGIAAALGERRSSVDFWTRAFAAEIGPTWDGADYNRWYTPAQVAMLREIHRLVRVELYTIAGAKRQLRLAAEREREAG